MHKHLTLANGLDVLIEPNEDVHSIAVGVFVKTGSRDEPADINGVSHFLEHMMFKGSAEQGWEDVNKAFDDIGARYNAFTSQEMTAYYANVLPEYADLAAKQVSNLLQPALREEDFETEKNVILEEIAMYADDPGHRLYEAVMAAYFDKHPLGLSILGPADIIKNMKRDRMEGYFRQRYGPGNMVLVITGKTTEDEAKRLAETYFGNLPRVDGHRDYAAPSPRATTQKLVDEKLNRTYTMALTPGPSAQDDRRFAARVLADVIGDSDGSRLYWALVDNATAEDADFGFYPHDNAGSFYLSLTTDPDRSEEAFDIAMKELRRVRDDLDEDEVERAKNKIASGVTIGGELPMGRLRSIASQWLYTGSVRTLEEDLQALRAVTVADLQDLLAAYPFDPMTVVTMGPQ